VNSSKQELEAFTTVNFMVNPKAADGTYTLNLNNILLRDENNVDIIDVMVNNGKVFIEEESIIVPPAPKSISVTPPTVTLDVTETQQFTTRILPVGVN